MHIILQMKITFLCFQYIFVYKGTVNLDRARMDYYAISINDVWLELQPVMHHTASYGSLPE